MVTKEYHHHGLGEEVHGPGWNYVVTSEERITVAGRDLFYIIAKAVVGSACIGSAQLFLIVIPGFIVTWHEHNNSKGIAVSIVEPVADVTDKREVQERISLLHRGLQILFL